jgi:hypothetical protein
MSRDPRRDEYTICTAVAPEAVFTVRTYATVDSLEADVSAQIYATSPTKPQVNGLCLTKITKCGTSQVCFDGGMLDTAAIGLRSEPELQEVAISIAETVLARL